MIPSMRPEARRIRPTERLARSSRGPEESSSAEAVMAMSGLRRSCPTTPRTLRRDCSAMRCSVTSRTSNPTPMSRPATRTGYRVTTNVRWVSPGTRGGATTVRSRSGARPSATSWKSRTMSSRDGRGVVSPRVRPTSVSGDVRYSPAR